MFLLSQLNVLLAGTWFGMYLFTTFVVSPAFWDLFPDVPTRQRHRRVLGRRYVRVNGPVTLALTVMLLGLSVTRGLSAALATEWGMLALLGLLIPLHVRAAGRHAPPSPWITRATFLVGLTLCGAAVAA